MSATATAAPLTDTEPDREAPPPRRRGRALLALVVLAAVAAACWLLFLRGGGEDAPEAPEEGAVVEVAQMTVNLAGADLHYVRFAFALVLAEGAVPGEVEPRFALLRDAALTVAQGFREDELRTPEGTARLREELSRRALEVYPDGPVLRVVLTELLVQ